MLSSPSFPVAALHAVSRCLIFLAVVTISSIAHGGDPGRLVELSDGTKSWTGRIVAKNSDLCYLLDRAGHMSEVSIPTLQSFKVVADTYKPLSASDFKKQLLTEFPNDYEIGVAGEYIVCGAKGKARAFAKLFDDVREEIQGFYRLRGFDVEGLETPLIAVVFQSQQELRDYCARDGMSWSDTLRGYYSLRTNRVVLYDGDEQPDTSAPETPRCELPPGGGILNRTDDQTGVMLDAAPAPLFAISEQVQDTIIHETTHQLSFNLGIHSRIGPTPMWILEGLATSLEAPGLRKRGGNFTERINEDRLDWFQNEAATRRKPGDVSRLIAGDELFRNQTLDAYSQAWALSWFLSENPARARQFMKYLKLVSDRSPFEEYSSADRLADFQTVFGDVARLEVDMLRRIDDVASGQK